MGSLGNLDVSVREKTWSKACRRLPQKIIIDTDPGVDDAMAILMAFQSPAIKVMGITTVFGNVRTQTATFNALHLCELAGRLDVPVAEGSANPLVGEVELIADFVHGKDGLGNTAPGVPKKRALSQGGVDFMVEMVEKYPGEITIVQLGPATNVAKALKKSGAFARDVRRIVVLGGAFFSPGNVNPAAEANIASDPLAADIVFTSGAKVLVVGINVTQQVILTGKDLEKLKVSGGRFSSAIASWCEFYRAWHLKSDNLDGIFVHDPSVVAAVLQPSLFSWHPGVVRVCTEGAFKGLTILDKGCKKWVGDNAWIGKPSVRVALGVNAEGVRQMVMELLSK